MGRAPWPLSPPPVLPDLSAVEVTGEGGGPVQVASIDVRKLDAKGLEALRLLRAQMEGTS